MGGLAGHVPHGHGGDGSHRRLLGADLRAAGAAGAHAVSRQREDAPPAEHAHADAHAMERGADRSHGGDRTHDRARDRDRGARSRAAGAMA